MKWLSIINNGPRKIEKRMRINDLIIQYNCFKEEFSKNRDIYNNFIWILSCNDLQNWVQYPAQKPI